jgi:hypothetical protein
MNSGFSLREGNFFINTKATAQLMLLLNYLYFHLLITWFTQLSLKSVDENRKANILIIVLKIILYLFFGDYVTLSISLLDWIFTSLF